MVGRLNTNYKRIIRISFGEIKALRTFAFLIHGFSQINTD
jgi:hypothetical protein